MSLPRWDHPRDRAARGARWPAGQPLPYEHPPLGPAMETLRRADVFSPAERASGPADGWSAPRRPARTPPGRPPRGYLRTDARIREDVCERMHEDPWLDASDVEVLVQDGEVTLEGRVASRGAKRYVEELCDDVLGVRDVHNRLRWRRETPRRERT